MSLTSKQERFCLSYVEKNSASDAYRAAYDAGKMKPETIHRKAWDLLQNGKVTARIGELRAEAASRTTLTVAGIIDDLMTIKNRTIEADPAIAVKVLELLGKHLNMWRDSGGQVQVFQLINAVDPDDDYS